MVSDTPVAGSALLGGKMVGYSVRISLRAKRLRIGVTPEDGLVVVAPVGFDVRLLPALLKSKESWVLHHLQLMEQCQARPAPCALENGMLVPYRGGSLKLNYRLGVTRNRVSRRRDELYVWLQHHDDESVRRALDGWYRAEARGLITARARELASQYGVSYQRIFIKAQKARWGSCSSRRNLNFNWRLVLAPPEILDYIVIHELTHLNEMSHSRHFWQLLAARCPEYRHHEAWLKEYGATLTF
jgi:predicted metal-dependent hydrolase